MQPSFIPYLTLNDYLTTIRSGQLNNQLLDEISQGGDFERKEAESFAIDEVRSVLGSFFYLDFEFKPTLPFSWNRKYHCGDRAIIDFPQWVSAQTKEGGIVDEETSFQYNIGDCVVYNLGTASINGQWIGYSCTTPNSDSTWNETHWIAIGEQYDIYFVNFPYPIFQLMPQVQIGISHPGLYFAAKDNVCWVDRIYSCRNDSIVLDHQSREQFYSINDIPSPNLFPNQVGFCAGQYTDGNRQWIDRGEFYYKNVLPSYPNEFVDDLNDGVCAWTNQYRKTWTYGDNRSNTMKQIIIAIAISKLLSRNSFQLKERSINRDWAYRKLERIRKGEDTTLIPILQPEQVGDISWGGMPKVVNTF